MMESKSNELISKLIEEPLKSHEDIFLLLKHNAGSFIKPAPRMSKSSFSLIGSS